MAVVNKIKNNKGIAIIFVILIIFILLFLSFYFLSFSTTERKIAKSQAAGLQAYYLAEAGINEMIWMIKNDPVFKNEFEYNAGWSDVINKADPLGIPGTEYEVTITNSSAAHADIVSVGKVGVGNGAKAQRVVKTAVYKATGASVVGTNAGYADGNIDISNSRVEFINGDAHSNNNFVVNNSADIYVERDLNAVGNYLPHMSITETILGNIHAANYPPAASNVIMPAVDFNSTSSGSFLNRADVVYTEKEFENLMKANQNLVLNDDITYVQGDVELKGAQTLTINGALIVEGDFVVGFKNKWGSRQGPSNLHINYATGTPAGVISSRHINFHEYTGIVKVKGVLYANDLMDITNITPGPDDFQVEGALIARKLTVTGSWEPIEVIYNAGIVGATLSSATNSPTIIIEHWEEEY